MSYYSNYRGQRTTQRSGYTSPSGGPPKRLLPEQLHDVFRVEINRLNDNREITEQNGLLFDSEIEHNTRGSDNDSRTNKYQLQSLYIGEIWRFRLKISNKMNENLHNFGLLCHVENNLKGTGAPMQLYPRPRELCPTQMKRNDNVSVDLEYPVISNEASSYSLIVTITASNEDDTQQLYKDIFEFHTVPCISLTFQKQTLDENLFVEALINNCSNQPQLGLFVNVNFKCLGLFKSYNLTHHNQSKLESAIASNEIYLDPEQEKNVLFQIKMKNPTSLVNLNALSVGQIQVKWRSNRSIGFREGIFLSDIIQRRSLFCRKLENQALSKTNSPGDNIEILILSCPSSCIVHQAFVVTFHIFNLDRYSHKLWLSIDKNTSGYLLPCNISKKYLGILEPSSSIKTDMTLVAFAPGIHVLTGIVIETQRLNTLQPMVVVKKTMHYESTQYIYIDIDPAFHAKKLKEKELKLSTMKQENEEEEALKEIDVEANDDNEENNNEEDMDDLDEDDVEILFQKQMETAAGTRGSLELKVDGNAAVVEQEFKIEPSPKHKPVIPPSSDLKPIGHQKSEQEIMAEVQEEQKQQISSLRSSLDEGREDEDEDEEPLEELLQEPLEEDADADAGDDADDDADDDANDDANDDADDDCKGDVDDVDDVDDMDDMDDDGESVEDELDQLPLEIPNEEEEEEKDNENNDETLDLRDLGASDPNESAISVAIKSSDEQEETIVTANMNTTDIIDENTETGADI